LRWRAATAATPPTFLFKDLDLLDEGEPGFWEQFGYHDDYGDPWREQRHQGG